MIPQFTYDNKGNAIGVFLPIDDWNQLIKEYPEVDFMNETSENNFVIPVWQIELGKKETQNTADDATELVEWEEAKKQFKL